MGKKPFITNKKKSAKFTLMPRDSFGGGGGGDPVSDRVFVRSDNNEYSVPELEEGDDELDDGEFVPDSIFADAPGDTDDDEARFGGGGGRSRGALPDDVRREIVELGLLDDGYNYLLHLREIRNTGTYYHNSRARLDRVPHDVRAFDASRLQINADANVEQNNESNSFYNVSSSTIGVRVQRVVDPDVARLLDDNDLSRFGSDIEELDEDFVVQANLPDGREQENEVREEATAGSNRHIFEELDRSAHVDGDDEAEVTDNPRVPRLIDEQFDLLALREYGEDSDDEEAGYVDPGDEPLAAETSVVLRQYVTDNPELENEHRTQGTDADAVADVDAEYVYEKLDSDVIQKCVEYAEKYCNDSQDDKEVVLVEESSDESEVWDCETIVSTYSNLDNHPGKIIAPDNPRKRTPKVFPGESISKDNVIALRGKEKLPVEFLPHNRRAVEQVKATVKPSAPHTEQLKRRPHGQESKEEKKERKAAVKEERREARRAKKDLKELYKCVSQKAQRVAAIAGPSSVHLM